MSRLKAIICRRDYNWIHIVGAIAIGVIDDPIFSIFVLVFVFGIAELAARKYEKSTPWRR